MVEGESGVRAGPMALTRTVPDAVPDADGDLAKRLDIDAQTLLRRSPETATEQGQDVGALADLRRRLDDRSAAGRAAWRGEAQKALGALSAIDGGAFTSKEP